MSRRHCGSNKRRTSTGCDLLQLRSDNMAQDSCEMKSMLRELLDQSSAQTTRLISMERKMASMESNMGRMARDIDSLNTRNDNLEESLRKAQISMGRMEDRQKYQEALIRNQKWTYSNAIQEHEASEAENELMEKIKWNTQAMRYGLDNGEVSVVVDVPDPGEERVNFYPSHMPHWIEFSNAIEQYRHALKCQAKESTSYLKINYVELPDEVTDRLSESLRSTHFHKFKLKNNDLGRRGIKFALDYVQTNPVLKCFKLVHNEMTQNDEVLRLGEIIKNHPSIKEINLSHCCGEGIDGYEMAKSVMKAGWDKLESIKLVANNINTKGRTFLYEYLTSNHVLRSLDLAGNDLDDNDAALIANALSRNTTLASLCLFGNSMTRAGWLELRRAVFDITDLNSAADSNHTCGLWPQPLEFHFLPTDERLDLIGINHFSEGEKVRREKIYTVLSKRNKSFSNARHLDGIAVELLPEMLSSIQRYSEDVCRRAVPYVKPLSVVYEIMRRWDTALSVYES